jgi:DNA topoisomerase-1
MKLIIVESPTKARTISRFLGNEVMVEASMGHIRDLPRSASEIPESVRGHDWARLGVNVDDGFAPVYVVPKERRDRVKKLKDLVKKADELFLATDEDREGESIAWHLTEVLKPKIEPKRMVFHEITEPAIRNAFEHPRQIDRRLVDAQEARRILDRLYGYEVSPVLWRRVRQGLSAGRVQSVAVRIVVERERERIRFRAAGYWDIEGTFAPASDSESTFPAALVAVDGKRVAGGGDFDETGQATRDEVLVLGEEAAMSLVSRLDRAVFAVRTVESKPYRRSPYPPFRTSTLQQEAGRKLRFSASRAMSVAQRLYEAGFITYMRTDSTALSEAALASARAQISQLYGSEYLPRQPRSYVNKVKNAQEAHEAIRPSGDRFRTPEQVAREVGQDEAKLYDLIWKRTIASQMNDATGESMQVHLGATSSDGTDAEFSASGRTITFPGFLRAYVEGSDDPEAALDDQETRLPALAPNQPLTARFLEAAGHTTKPPPRYTEASLVRRLEELGVGRPSTYASILATIEDRGYVWKKGQALVPTFTAFAVVSLLEDHFPDLVDYAFTARMEDDLDRIADGEEQTVPWLTRFYLGAEGLRTQVEERLEEIDARQVNSINLGPDPGGREVVLRVGRYGPYLERDGDRASVPDNLPPDELTIERAVELLEEQPAGDKILGTDPQTGKVVLAKHGRYGPYVQLGEAEGIKKEKPKTSSLFKSMSIDELSLEQALALLTLPRVVGSDPDTGADIVAQNGRYGPYLTRGSDRRSLEAEDQLFTVNVDQAIELFRQPPRRRGQRAAASSGRQMGNDPVSGKMLSVRTGRFGPYVTDGEINASLRTGDDPETITIERATELMAARRERLAAEPPKPATKKSSTRKSTTPKSGATKRGTRKPGAKKTAVKKTGVGKKT